MASVYNAIVQCHILTAIFLVQRLICDFIKSKLIRPNCESETLVLLLDALTENIVATVLVATVANLYVRRRLRGFILSLWSDRASFGNFVARCLLLSDETYVTYITPGKRGIFRVNHLLFSSFYGGGDMKEMCWVHSIVAILWGACIIYGRDRIPKVVPKVAPVPNSTRGPSNPKRHIRFIFMCFSMLSFSICARIVLVIADGYFKTPDVEDGVVYFGIYGGLCAETFATVWALWISNSFQAKYKGSVCLMCATMLSLMLLQLVGDGMAPQMFEFISLKFVLRFVLVFAGFTVNGATSLLREAWSLDLPVSQTIGMVILLLDPFGSFGILVGKLVPPVQNTRNCVIAIMVILAVCGMSVPDSEKDTTRSEKTS